MNAKIGLDPFRVNLPNLMNTLLIGVDFIMNGSSTLIGCCATSSKTMARCYTKIYKQKISRPTEEHFLQFPGKSYNEIQEILTTIERTDIIKYFVNEAYALY
jgi:hypothetical protein